MMRARGCAAALAALALVVTAGCGSRTDRAEKPAGAPAAAGNESGAPPAAGVATVNGVVISEAQFAGALRDAAFSAKAATLAGRRQVLDRMIDRELAVQAAAASGAERLPIVQRAVDRMRRQDLMSQFSRQIAVKAGGVDSAAVDKAVGPLPQILEATVLLVDDAALAGEFARRIRAGEDFAVLQAEHAEGPGSEIVHRRQFITRLGSTMYPPEVETRIFAMKQGDVAALATTVGSLVIRIDVKRDMSEAEVANTRSTVGQKLIEEGLRTTQLDILSETRRKYPVKRFVESFADQPAVGKDLTAAWRTFQETTFATVGPITLKLDELYRNMGDYDLMARSGKESQRAAFNDMSERVISSALYSLAARDRGLKPSAEIEQRIARDLPDMMLQAFTVDLILTVKRDKLGREQCQGLFEKAPARYLPDERLNFRQILVRRESQAQDVAARLSAGEDFAKLAKELSADVSAAQGGDMGWRTRRELEDLFGKEGAQDLLQRASSGLTGNLTLRTTKGYHVLLLGGYRRPGEGNYEEGKERILDDCLAVQRGEVAAKEAAKWREKAKISIDEAKLASVEPLPGMPADGTHRKSPGMGGAPPSHGGMGGPSHGKGGANPH